MTEFAVTSPLRKRVYVRRFDYDEAARRYAAGERVADLAAEYGVTRNAVYMALVTVREGRERYNAVKKAWRTGVCEDCGGPAMRLVSGKARPGHDGLVLCIACRSIEKAERLRWDERGEFVAVRCCSLDCANGERWQPPEHFPRGVRNRAARDGGIAGMCRACQTRGRREYRHSSPERLEAARAYERERRRAARA